MKVEAQNAKGKKIKKKYTDWTARIFQVEQEEKNWGTAVEMQYSSLIAVDVTL